MLRGIPLLVDHSSGVDGSPSNVDSEWADRRRQALTTRHSHEDVLNDREFELCWRPVEIYRLRGALRRGSSVCLAAALASVPGRSHTPTPPASTGTANSSESHSTNRVTVGLPAASPPRSRPQGPPLRRRRRRVSLAPQDRRLRPIDSVRPVAANRTVCRAVCKSVWQFSTVTSTINRRGKEAADQADLTERVYSHCLRATAASHHTYRGVVPVPLQT